MAEYKVSKEVAQKEIESWLDYKNVSPRKREENESSIEELVEALMDGTLSIDEETYEITHSLRVPIYGPENNLIAKQLKYKARLTVFETQNQLKGVKASDTDGRVLAYICALSNESKNIIRYMDTVDYSISQQIVVFFL